MLKKKNGGMLVLVRHFVSFEPHSRFNRFTILAMIENIMMK